ncbi:FliH/SctL family protein [Burkholderia ubonensis]|uniref:FliH/SctL family protein n=1 Tax=Burkholderia ubonensis TaxID=101571 RepID=UPI000AF9BDDA|nr:FliH/SctL family protein [Burkholderia ubonensis]
MYFKVAVGDRDACNIVGETRVLKRADMAQLEKVIDLIRHFEEEMEQLRAELMRTNETAEKAGYDEGMQRANREYADRLLEASQFVEQSSLRFETSFGNAVRLAVSRIIDVLPDANTVEHLIRTAYRDMSNEQVIRVVVHVDHREQIEKVFRKMTDAQAILIVGDFTVPRRFCRIESAQGCVEMNVDMAIEAITASVSRALYVARVDGVIAR